ncbi:MAG: sensor domain-containing diguanylate cyclase, partial [Proteobacteria bacterium]|nr:sensor domain-containing diguanylate cyclase [Pseudomonadota bacterium]
LLGELIEVLVPAAQRDGHRAHRQAYDRNLRSMGARMDIVGVHADGHELPLEVSISPVATSEGRFVICIARDATERRTMMSQLRDFSYRDALTGLYSRAFFDAELARLDVARQMPVVCFVFDVDGLKVVNDTRGHAAGDELIQRAANLLRQCVRSEDILARIGGDEFAALLPSMSSDAAEMMLARIREALAQQVLPTGGSALSLSIGWASALEPPIADAIRSADERMYEVKRVTQSIARVRSRDL